MRLSFQYLGAIHLLSVLCMITMYQVTGIALRVIMPSSIMLEQYAAAKQQQQQAYEGCSSRVLLKGRWVLLLLLLSARVPVFALPRRARVCQCGRCA